MQEILKLPQKQTRYKIGGSVIHLDELLSGELPSDDEVYKLISNRHFSIISLIVYIAQHTIVRNLYVSTFGVGRKEVIMLHGLHQQGRIENASFITGMVVAGAKKASAKTRNSKIVSLIEQNGWRHVCIRNHAKLVLLDTDAGKYVIETSSNLNENPSIEFFSFERSSEGYEFYRDWFELWLKQSTNLG